MYGKMKEFLQKELADIREAGLYKEERIIASPQRAEIEVGGKKVLNFCANARIFNQFNCFIFDFRCVQVF